MIIVRIFIPLGIILGLVFLGRYIYREIQKSNIEQKLENIETQNELYNKVKDIDVEEVNKQKKVLDSLEGSDTI